MPALILTEEQEALANLRDGCFLVVAPPGSGKTEVIAHRIMRLLAATEGTEANILALSYTKNAAASMQRRVTSYLGEQPRRALFTNYHAFCYDALVHYGRLIGLGESLTIYETVDDRLQALSQGLTDEGFLAQGTEIPRREGQQCLDEIGRLKRGLVLPAAAPESASALGFPLNAVYRAYDLALMQNAALDFDSILLNAYQLFTQQPRVAEHYRSIYQYILIDEAQDTSAIQYEILRALCGTAHRNVFMVADPAQSIFSFTGASARHTESFLEDFGAERRVLSTTFRCGQRVIETAQRLAKAAGRPWAVALTSKSVAPGLATFDEFDDEPAEARAAADWAQELLASGLPLAALGPNESPSIAPEQIAILGRTRFQLQALVTELDSRGVDYHFAAGDAGIFEADEYRILLYCLKVLANPKDAAIAGSLVAAARRIAATHRFEVAADKAEAAELFWSLATEFGESPLGKLFWLCHANADSPSIDDTLDGLLDWAPSGNGESLADGLLDGDRDFFLNRVLAFRANTSPEARSWAGLTLELGSAPKPEAPGIRLLTVHAAKGLEFLAVSVVGMNEGAFPDFRNSDGEALESERRLIYVAVTRAARVLRLTRPRVRATRFGQRLQNVSRFVEEAGLAH